ncbi:MAG: hypothetical protein L7F78_20195 [Syntrophales bacterium LBB04]|nr:hypothetical protein [Syntrophales bacterium LBB04]
MGSIPGTGTLDGYRNIKVCANLFQRGNVTLPAFFVKVDSEKVACLILAQGIYADNDVPSQMRFNDFLVKNVV